MGRMFGLVLALFLIYFWIRPVAGPNSHARKRVRFWHMWTAEWKEVVDRVVTRFNASQTEYEVEALSVPGAGADSKFILGVLGGDPPDVMAQWNPVIPSWADAHLLRPLDELMSPDERRTFLTQAYPVVRKIGMYKGRVYGMCIGVNMSALYYLPEHLREAGLPVRAPRSLEELDAWWAKLNKFDAAGDLTRLGWLPVDFKEMVALFGGGLYDSKIGRLTIDTPANRRAMDYLAAGRRKLGFQNVLRFMSGLNVDSAAEAWPFITGAYSFTLDGQWRVEQIGKYAPSLEYATAPVPPPEGGRARAGISNGNFMIVPEGAKEPRGAWEFINFWSGLTKPDVAAEFYTWGGWLPLTPAVADAPLYRAYLRKYPQFKTFVDLMPSERIDVLPPVPFQTFINDQILSGEDAAEHGSLIGDQAVAQMARKIADEEQRRRELGYDR